MTRIVHLGLPDKESDTLNSWNKCVILVQSGRYSGLNRRKSTKVTKVVIYDGFQQE